MTNRDVVNRADTTLVVPHPLLENVKAHEVPTEDNTENKKHNDVQVLNNDITS